jgi:hypothetical protein
VLIHAGRQIRGEYSELIRAAAEEGRLSAEEWGSKDGTLAKVTPPDPSPCPPRLPSLASLVSSRGLAYAFPPHPATSWERARLTRALPLPLTSAWQIVLFDQLSRNSFRGTAEAFSYDPAAREVATPRASPQRMRRRLS